MFISIFGLVWQFLPQVFSGTFPELNRKLRFLSRRLFNRRVFRCRPQMLSLKLWQSKSRRFQTQRLVWYCFVMFGGVWCIETRCWSLCLYDSLCFLFFLMQFIRIPMTWHDRTDSYHGYILFSIFSYVFLTAPFTKKTKETKKTCSLKSCWGRNLWGTKAWIVTKTS